MSSETGHAPPDLLGSLRVLLDRAQHGRFLLLLLGTVLAAGLEMVGIGAIPAFVALWVDPDRLFAMLPDTGVVRAMRVMDPTRLTLLSAGALVVLFVVKNSYILGLLYAESAILRDLSVSLSRRLFRAYLLSPYTFHLQRNPAELIRNISSEVTEAVRLLRNMTAVFRESLVLAVVLLLLLLIDPLVSLSVFTLLGTTAAGFYLLVGRKLARRGGLAQAIRARQLQAVQQGLGAIREARILGREQHLIDAFDEETAAKEGHEMYHQVVLGLPRLFLEVVAVLAVLLVAAVFVLLGRSAQAMLPVLSLLAVAVVRIVPALNSITSSLTRIRYQRAALDVISRELATLGTQPVEPGSAPGGELDELRAAVTFHGVEFAYPDQAVPALRGVSCRIDAGSAVAFIGPSGAGKSTLIDVLLGLLPPTSGAVCADGRNIHDSLRSWQRQIGYVPQDIYLTDDTIRRNIAFAVPDAEIDDGAIAVAVTTARLDGMLAELPEGLNAVVGDRGVRLSGGQRQRIGIARALYHDPAVLVMDEATSALDAETEREIIEAIGALRGDRTVVIISHRLSTVASCDRLYLIEDGQVSDHGTWEEMLGRHERLRQRSAVGLLADAEDTASADLQA
jgi:ATP-binding cassette, subfamily B, bacterial PglK